MYSRILTAMRLLVSNPTGGACPVKTLQRVFGGRERGGTGRRGAGRSQSLLPCRFPSCGRGPSAPPSCCRCCRWGIFCPCCCSGRPPLVPLPLATAAACFAFAAVAACWSWVAPALKHGCTFSLCFRVCAFTYAAVRPLGANICFVRNAVQREFPNSTCLGQFHH